ncbi:F-box only protein 11 [Homalodisca vitripennis]|nr:F-box only protein 11 [Homalodisca vitripennis]
MSESSKILSTPIKLSSSNTSLIATSFKLREAMIATSTAGCNERHVSGTKTLYHNVYEYDLPLFNPAQCRFEFVPAEESEHANPWKESFRHLYRGVHVRPGYQNTLHQGRRIAHFDTVQGALEHVDSFAGSALIFLHAGTYRGEFLVIDSDVSLIGAAPGNVAESVILERESESTVMFVEGAKNAYAGHLTLKFSPDVASNVPHNKHYCLEVGENCSPTIDHCIIRSSSLQPLNLSSSQPMTIIPPLPQLPQSSTQNLRDRRMVYTKPEPDIEIEIQIRNLGLSHCPIEHKPLEYFKTYPEEETANKLDVPLHAPYHEPKKRFETLSRIIHLISRNEPSKERPDQDLREKIFPFLNSLQTLHCILPPLLSHKSLLRRLVRLQHYSDPEEVKEDMCDVSVAYISLAFLNCNIVCSAKLPSMGLYLKASKAESHLVNTDSNLEFLEQRMKST